ncbi:nuclear transport factor 2 family protein [Flavobacterium sp. F52]|uniref:nuclear transport factor 2 family protein n=1 Tax=Flavobacterium sp. F52 TaxID=1202532 RepID=UPI000272D870|nr:nuclear transport factor 2 family protein [Flavobacterium sp. F52]EJG03183.1 hypothetical protein FF52_03285 [Flavobacterium sp. F52]
MENQNKKTIAEAFKKWEEGTASFFDLLDEKVNWTITGNSAISKVYTSKQQFMDEAIIPLNKRFEIKIRPKVREIYAEGDTVIALWDGLAVAIDGEPYSNTYSWYMTMKDGKIHKAVAFFDAIELNAIWNRISIDQ